MDATLQRLRDIAAGVCGGDPMDEDLNGWTPSDYGQFFDAVQFRFRLHDSEIGDLKHSLLAKFTLCNLAERIVLVDTI